MLRARHDDPERGIHGEQREILRQRQDVEDGERCSVGKRDPTERVRGRHGPKPLMLFVT
jgi:hypothetical protein